MAQFQENLSGANLVFLGFEENQENASYRVYLEYWDKICGEIKQAPHKTHPRLMFLGYKRDIEHPQRQAISEYTCYPLLSTSEIAERITGIYKTAKDRCMVGCLHNIIDRAVEQAGDRNFIYLEVSETGSRRSSFDLNLYKSRLRIDDLEDILIDLQGRYKIKEPPFFRLLELVGPKRLGHISGGITGDGEEFVTCYYEN